MEALATLAPTSERAATPGSISVLVLAPEEIVWCGIRLMLGRPDWLGRYLVAPSLGEAEELAARFQPEVALVDMRVHEATAGEACAAVGDASPRTRLLLMTTAAQVPSRTVAALGAEGFVAKDWSSALVAETVRCAGFGRELPEAAVRGDHGLSGRQLEILELLAEGRTYEEIAALLRLSRNTVKQHTSAVYRKLEVRNRAAAIGNAQAMGLLA